MEEIIQIIAAFFCSIAFALLYNIRGKKAILAGFGGMIAWAIYIGIGIVYPHEMIQYFFAAVFVTWYSEFLAPILKTPVTVFLSPGIIPFVPGRGLYYTMSYALNGEVTLFTEMGLNTLGTAVSIAAGIMAASAVYRIVRGIARFNKRKRLT
ncbi:threonine/serine exporter family protein [Desemzia sp. RIT804]|uniref:threonine/serine exporter family protein n=1 Tax=Desemzia sp. RIT 804 TaxID=2810209 RepID=UPI00194E996E|nr:threonine/serine exporter family protein [Desemzia sp. RIT 804]MBM6615411.1 threonine/serine exporter family protein [Desemzia sp. RIT 804]